MTTKLDPQKSKDSGNPSTYGFTDGLLTRAVQPSLIGIVDSQKTEEMLELAEAIRVLQEACERYVKYLRANPSELALKRSQSITTINHLKEDLLNLSKLDDDLGMAIELRRENERKPHEAVLSIKE